MTCVGRRAMQNGQSLARDVATQRTDQGAEASLELVLGECRALTEQVEEVLRKRFNKGVDPSYTEWLVHERELARGEGGGEARVPPQGPPSLLIGKRRIKWELRFFRPSAPAVEQCVPLLVLPTRRPR